MAILHDPDELLRSPAPCRILAQQRILEVLEHIRICSFCCIVPIEMLIFRPEEIFGLAEHDAEIPDVAGKGDLATMLREFGWKILIELN